MSNHQNQEQKMKKFRKMHIWPSVLFLLFSIAGAVFGFCAFVTLSLMAQIGERINNSYVSADNVINALSVAPGNEEAVLERFKGIAFASDAVFVVDENGETVAGYGEKTYSDKWQALPKDLFDFFIINTENGDDYLFSNDNDFAPNLITSNTDLNFMVLLVPINIKNIFRQGNSSNEVLFSARYWIKTTLPNQNTVYIKCTAPLYTSDFAKVSIFGAAGFTLMMLPTLFFFINIIISLRNQHRMTRLLFTDTVTMGRSYIYFEHNAGKMLHARGNANKLLMFADLTVIKYRNYCNFHGTHAGELLLENIDREICRYLQQKEICAHSGKASFALLLKAPDAAQGEARIKALVNALSEKYAYLGIRFHAGSYMALPQPVSVRKKMDAADCLGRASAARASLTDDNVSATAVYNDKLLEEQLWIHKVEEKMLGALDREEFKVYIQPKYNPVTNELAGGEALIRWINEEDGFISPGRFIPIFESNGFITKIDDYMISHVARLQSEWLAAGKPVVPISVNVSRAHFSHPDLAEHISELVDAYAVPHHLIEIELTESAFFDDKEALLRIVHNLRDLGFEISMDDFGAGYSSLNSLKDLPLDVLKLDAEFFRGEDSENRREIVVSQAIRLAKSLNMRIVAEGVEEKDQVDFLAGQGCDMIQGFYFAKPMPAEEYAQKL